MPLFDPPSTSDKRGPFEARFHPLDIGLIVSITHNHSDPLAATVVKIGPELVVQLARANQKLPFKQGNQVLIKYWAEDRIAYFWQVNVMNCSRLGHLTFSTLGAGMTIQQRKSYRVPAAIPVSFTIIDASDIQLNGEKVSEVMSQDISEGGLLLEQRLLLTVGDKLELQLHFPSSEPVYAVGWVVRCEPISVDKRPLHTTAIEFLLIDQTNRFRLLESLVQLQKLSH